MQEQAELTPLAQLGKAFDFSNADLRANRDRQLTRRQRRAIWMRFLVTLFYWLMLLTVPSAVGLVLLTWGSDKSLAEIIFSTEAAIGYGTGALLSSFYAAVHYQTLLLVVDAFRGRVVAVSGPVRRYGQYLYLNQRRFLLETDSHDLIQNGVSYTLYILPGSQHILSIEFAE